MADNAAKIAEIRDQLRTGASQVSTDGTTVMFNEAQLRKELRQLLAEDRNNRGRRPVASSIKLG
jgi:hypothetical protein